MADEIQILKSELRRHYRQIRKDIDEVHRKEEERRMEMWVGGLLREREEIRVVAVYLSVRDEFPTQAILERCWAAGCVVCVPRWNAAKEAYELAEYQRGGRIEMGPSRIPQPDVESRIVKGEEVDLYLVPGLAFDREGGRLGYGGGWYDRMLAEVREDCLCWGVCFEAQITERSLPMGEHDVRVWPAARRQ